MWPWDAFNFSLTPTWGNECPSAHSCVLSWFVLPVQLTSAANLVKDSFPCSKCNLFFEVTTLEINFMINRIHVESHPVYNGWLWKDGNCLDALARGHYVLDASVIDTLTWHLTLHASACFTIFLVRLPWQENSSTKHLSRHTWIFWLFGVSGLACKTNHWQKITFQI